jgi:hypothetical protein
MRFRKAVPTILVVVSCVTASGLRAGDPAGHRDTAGELLWETRGQDEPSGAGLDVDGNGHMLVVAGDVGEAANSQWFVRGLERRTGAVAWEDRHGPMTFGLAKDVAVDGDRAFVAGWTRTAGLGFQFVVRAYEVGSGAVLWSREIGTGPQCLEEVPRFARCVAKAVAVQDGRVFVVGHLTRTAQRADFAVLAFDAATGAPLWESVTDPTGTGANDYAWAVRVSGRHVFVVGEYADFGGLIVQAHDARTGAIRWQQREPGAGNSTLKDTLAAAREGVFVAGFDASFRFFVKAYDAETGAPRWEDHLEGLGQATALALSGSDARDGGADEGSGPRIIATGVVGCDPATFLDCELGLRAYDAQQGLVWQVADVARGGDWYMGNVTAAGGRLYVDGSELLEDGLYHPTVRAYRANDGGFEWNALFDDGTGHDPFGNGFTGFTNGVFARGGRLHVAGDVNRADGNFDFLVRTYRAR